MKKCKYCQTEIDPKAKICPNCRKKQGVPGCVIFLLIFIGIIIFFSGVFSILGDSSVDSSNSDVINEAPSSSNSSNSAFSEKFSYSISDSYSDGYSYYIEGVVTNNRSKDYNYVQIEFICYDKNGNNLGTALDNTNNLLGNQTWKYKAFGLFTDGSSVDHCDFHQISGW